MRYNQLLKAGREMTAQEINDSIRGLAADPRFAAVVAMLSNNRESFSVIGSAQKLADHHGSLAHCMGTVHALVTLEGQLRNVIDPPRTSRGMQREEGA